MHRIASDFYELTRRFHEDAYKMLKKLDELTRAEHDMHNAADTAFAMQQTEKFLEDTRKESKKLRELAEKIACALWVKDSNESNIKTDHVTATPNIKQTAALPSKKRDPEAYAELMTWLGIDEELWKDDNEVVRPYWPGFVERLSGLAAEGKPLPPGINPDKTYSQYSLRIHKKKEVNE